MGPPPPPLPPPFKAINHTNTIEPSSIDIAAAIDRNDVNGNGNGNGSNQDSDELDSDSGLEVIEEPTLRPSELVRGNHNRTMSIISGKYRFNAFGDVVLIDNDFVDWRIKSLCTILHEFPSNYK